MAVNKCPHLIANMTSMSVNKKWPPYIIANMTSMSVNKNALHLIAKMTSMSVNKNATSSYYQNYQYPVP